MTDYTPPERIYLQTHEDGEEIAEKTHCEDRIHDTDTEYIRADLVEAAKRLGAIEALQACMDAGSAARLDHDPSGEMTDVYVAVEIMLAALKAEADFSQKE